jgi:hypothetical protein
MIVHGFAFCLDSDGCEMGLVMAVDFGVRFTLTCDADYLHMFLDADEEVRSSVDVPTDVWQYLRAGWPDDWDPDEEWIFEAVER